MSDIAIILIYIVLLLASDYDPYDDTESKKKQEDE